VKRQKGKFHNRHWNILPATPFNRGKKTESDATESLLMRLDTVAPLTVVSGVLVLNRRVPKVLPQD